MSENTDTLNKDILNLLEEWEPAITYDGDINLNTHDFQPAEILNALNYDNCANGHEKNRIRRIKQKFVLDMLSIKNSIDDMLEEMNL
jgi:hypothetical protein